MYQVYKVNDCCAKESPSQSFQLKKSQNNQRYLDKSFRYHNFMELMQNNICNKFIHVGKLNCHEVIISRFFKIEI